METTFKKIVAKYGEIMSHGDPRVEDWFMMSNPWLSVVVCLIYTIMVVKILPKQMENREAYNIRYIMVAYNMGMIVLCGYIFIEFLLSGWGTTYSLGCQPVDYGHSPQALRMARVSWWFFISKFVELWDTVFFVMRKKYNLITFLHVFHHGIMPCSWWFGVKFVPGGFGTFHGMCNAFIHVLMYTYYCLAAMGPSMQKYIWWKKYITKMQLAQFVIVGTHASQLFFMECDYPKLFAYWIAGYSVIFFCLFINYYIKAYKMSRAKRNDKKGNAPVALKKET